jgi:hypothetical protein
MLTRPFLHISQIPLNKETSFLLKSLEERPSMFPISVAPVETDVHFQSFSISFRVTSKRALCPGSPHRALSERDAPFLEPSFIHL